MEGFGRGQL